MSERREAVVFELKSLLKVLSRRGKNQF